MKRKVWKKIFVAALAFALLFSTSGLTAFAGPFNPFNPGGGSSSTMEIGHIDIGIYLKATVIIDGQTKDINFELTTADKDNVTITNDSGEAMTVTRVTAGGGVAGNPEIRFEGSFPVGTQEDPISYTVVLNKNVPVDTGEAIVDVPVTLSATMQYWSPNNTCPGFSNRPWSSSGIDLTLGHGSGSHTTEDPDPVDPDPVDPDPVDPDPVDPNPVDPNPVPTGTIQVQKTVSGATLASDTYFYFDIYAGEELVKDDLAVKVLANGTIGTAYELGLAAGNYTVVEDTDRAALEGYTLDSTTYSSENGAVTIDETTNYAGVVNVTNTYSAVDPDPVDPDPVDPDPVDPDPVDPDPVDPDPVDPDPVDPDPVDPDPIDPDPVDPDPVDPDPVDPDPVDPDPVDPDPVDPEPYQDDVPVPTSETSGDGLVDIFDEEVPLADVPKTGDAIGLWMMLSGGSLAGLAVLNKKKRK